MYRPNRLEQLNPSTAAPPRRRVAAYVSPTLSTLGDTSLLTGAVVVTCLTPHMTVASIGAPLLGLFLFGLHCAAIVMTGAGLCHRGACE